MIKIKKQRVYWDGLCAYNWIKKYSVDGSWIPNKIDYVKLYFHSNDTWRTHWFGVKFT